MKLSKANQWHLDHYVDFEYRVTSKELEDVLTYKGELSAKDAESFGIYFRQMGNRVLEVKGLDKMEQNHLFGLSREFTPERFIEFGKRLVDVNPNGDLSMQQVIFLESRFTTLG